MTNQVISILHWHVNVTLIIRWTGTLFTSHTWIDTRKDRFSICWATHSARFPTVWVFGFSTVALTGGSPAGVKERKREFVAARYQLFLRPTANYSTQPEQLPHHSYGSGLIAHARRAAAEGNKGRQSKERRNDLGHIHFIIKGPELKEKRRF